MTFDPSVFFDALTSKAFIEGAQLTIEVTIVAMIGGLALGLVLALMRSHRWRAIRWLAWAYIWVFRAVPTLVQLLFVWDALPQLIPALRGQWFSAFLAAAIALAMNEAAYAAEVLRAGLLSIDEGQRLAARALGLTPRKVFTKVVVPQLIRVTIPPLSNDLITMLKLTSLASVISLQELLARTQSAVSLSYQYAEYFGAAAVWYLAIVSVLMVVQSAMERRYVWTSQGREGGGAMRSLARQLAPLR
jgi:polar amino acid transport system permease protein